MNGIYSSKPTVAVDNVHAIVMVEPSDLLDEPAPSKSIGYLVLDIPESAPQPVA